MIGKEQMGKKPPYAKPVKKAALPKDAKKVMPKPKRKVAPGKKGKMIGS